MKYLLIILIFFSCCTPKKATVVKADPVIIHDTIRIEKRITDTVFVQANNDSIKKIITGLNNKLFLANFKIERVRYYLKICQRNPSQTKFLVSWIHRAIN